MPNQNANVKLIINIDHKNPVSLMDLTIGLNAIGSLYNNFTKDDKEAKLLVKEIRKGSIEIDLVTLSTLSAIPLINNINNIVQFCHYIKLLIATASKSSSNEIKDIESEHFLPSITTSNLKDFSKSLNIVPNDADSIDIRAVDLNSGTKYINCTFNGFDAKQMSSNIDLMLKTSNSQKHTKLLFKWEQTNHSSSKTGNKALVDNLSKKPMRVIFDNDGIKEQMTTSVDGIDWDKKYYVVDIDAQTSEGNLVLFKVTKNYSEESFSIS